MQKYFFKPLLHGISDVHVALGNFAVRQPRRAQEIDHSGRIVTSQLDRTVFLNGHALRAAERHEVIEIKMKGPVVKRNDLANGIAISRPSIRGEAHHLAFIAILAITEKFAKHGIE